MTNLEKAKHYAKYSANLANPMKARTAAWAVSKSFYRMYLREIRDGLVTSY